MADSKGQPMGFLEFIDEAELPQYFRTLSPPPEIVGSQQDSRSKENEEKKEKKRIIIADTFADLPLDIQKQVRKNGIEPEQLDERRFLVLLNVLRFVTKQTYKTSKQRQEEKEEKHSQIQEYVDHETYAPPSMLIKTDETLLVDPNVKKCFKNVEFSGKGGFGSVFFAHQVSDKSQVAIKKMDHVTEKEIFGNLSEVSFLKACNHPNIVKYLKSYKLKQELWLVMEFMEGGTLAEAVKVFDFKESHIAFVAKEVLKGIKYLHSLNWAHRDLKSNNIMMTIKGEVKLSNLAAHCCVHVFPVDFGLCVDLSTRERVHMVGSPFWMPPEMIQNKPHGLAADIWSFALCLLEMVNKTPPNKDSKMRALFVVGTEGLESFVQQPSCSSELRDFLSKCLKMDPKERATAAELLEHPFLQKADTQKSMESVIATCFISRSMNNVGLF